MHKHAIESGVTFWAYCLMDNHVHLIAVPEKEDSLAKGIGEAHRKYTRMINFREGWKGYLWQGRFISYPLDERYLYAAVRYVERNPNARTTRPLGDKEFLARLEKITGRRLRKRKPGPKRKRYYWVHKIDCILVVYLKNSSSAFADNLCQTGLTGSS